jgi:hypothetical protein
MFELWKKQLDHLHYGAFPPLKDMVVGLPNFKVKRKSVCTRCVLEKHANTTFPRRDHKVIGTLDIVQSNACEPISTSLIGNIYYISFSNDSSGKRWIYFIMTKVEVKS